MAAMPDYQAALSSAHRRALASGQRETVAAELLAAGEFGAAGWVLEQIWAFEPATAMSHFWALAGLAILVSKGLVSAQWLRRKSRRSVAKCRSKAQTLTITLTKKEHLAWQRAQSNQTQQIRDLKNQDYRMSIRSGFMICGIF